MYKIKKRVSKRKMMSITEAENRLFSKLGVPVCPHCKHAMSAKICVAGANYLLCPFCGETVPDCEGE